MLTHSRYYEPHFRFNRLQSESKMVNNRTERQLHLSPQHSIDADKLRYKLIPRVWKNTSLSNHFTREESRVLPSELDPIDRDIWQLEKELQYKRSLRRHLERSKYQGWKATPTQTSEDEDFRLFRKRTQQSKYNESQEQTFWHNPDIFRSTRKKIKIYKIKPKKTQQFPHLLHEISDELPIIDKIRLGRSDKAHKKQYVYEIFKTPTVGRIYTRHRNNLSSKHYRYLAWRRFRKVAHAVLFTIYLRKFNERMRRNREGHFQHFVREQVKDKLLSLKNFLIEHSQPFFLALISQNSFDYTIHEKEDPQLKREKQKGLKKLIELELDCLDKGVRTMANREFFSELLYYLCKHGNYASSYQMHTTEQLSLLCISEAYGYSSADKYLESSAILSLVFFKILLFNILLQPSKLSIFENYTGNREVIFKNIRMIATIIYELLIDIQDNFLEKADGVYTIGNWKKTKFKMTTAQSMTVKAGFYQKNELISGLADHKYVKDIYGTRFMMDYKNMIEQFVRLLHLNIVELHQRIRRKYF